MEDKSKTFESQDVDEQNVLLKEISRLFAIVLGKTSKEGIKTNLFNKGGKSAKSKTFYNDFIEKLEYAKERYEKLLKAEVKKNVLLANKKIDLELMNELSGFFNSTTQQGGKKIDSEIEKIISKSSEKRNKEILKIIENTIKSAAEDQEEIIKNKILDTKAVSTKRELSEKYLTLVRKNFITCSYVYPEMSRTWNLMEDRFPHLRDEELNELVKNFYYTINVNLKKNNNLAFLKLNKNDDIELKIIELNYVLNKGAKEENK